MCMLNCSFAGSLNMHSGGPCKKDRRFFLQTAMFPQDEGGELCFAVL